VEGSSTNHYMEERMPEELITRATRCCRSCRFQLDRRPIEALHRAPPRSTIEALAPAADGFWLLAFEGERGTRVDDTTRLTAAAWTGELRRPFVRHGSFPPRMIGRIVFAIADPRMRGNSNR
jgi:hypothetical protein